MQDGLRQEDLELETSTGKTIKPYLKKKKKRKSPLPLKLQMPEEFPQRRDSSLSCCWPSLLSIKRHHSERSRNQSLLGLFLGALGYCSPLVAVECDSNLVMNSALCPVVEPLPLWLLVRVSPSCGAPHRARGLSHGPSNGRLWFMNIYSAFCFGA